MPSKFSICLMDNRPSFLIILVVYACIESVEAMQGAPGGCLSLIYGFADPPVNLFQ